MINAHSRGVSIRVVQTIPTNDYQWNDSLALSNLGVIELRSLDLNKLIGAGILHTKLWIVDGQHFYVGSANTDWRALTQVSYSLYVMTVCQSKENIAKGCVANYLQYSHYKANCRTFFTIVVIAIVLELLV